MVGVDHRQAPGGGPQDDAGVPARGVGKRHQAALDGLGPFVNYRQCPHLAHSSIRGSSARGYEGSTSPTLVRQLGQVALRPHCEEAVAVGDVFPERVLPTTMCQTGPNPTGNSGSWGVSVDGSSVLRSSTIAATSTVSLPNLRRLPLRARKSRLS